MSLVIFTSLMRFVILFELCGPYGPCDTMSLMSFLSPVILMGLMSPVNLLSPVIRMSVVIFMSFVILMSPL